MAFYLSPLVDVNELDLTTTIPAVATSVGVIVLRNTYKGPERKRQLVTTVDELIEEFGEPTSRSYQDTLAATGYLKYGTNLYCTRVMPVSASFAGCYGTATSAATYSVYTSGVAGDAYILGDFSGAGYDPDDYPDVAFGAGSPESAAAITFIAASRGAWGNNIDIAVIGQNMYSKVTSGSGTSELSATLWSDVDDADYPIESSTEFIVIVKVTPQDGTAASVKEVHYVSTNPSKINDEGKNLYIENVINQESDYIRVALAAAQDNADWSEVYTADYVSLGGGQDSIDNYSSDTVTDADIIIAYELYDDPEVIDVNLFIDSNKSGTVKAELVEICETDRKDSFAILDCLYSDVVNNVGNEATDLRDWRLGTFNTSSSYASVYGNWLEVYDKWNATYRWIPASGHVAGIFANNDDLADPWWAPAGLNRAIIQNVRKLAWNPTKGQRDTLYKNGINPIASFSGLGKVVWGQKTILSKPSAFNRVNVRRLFLTLEKSIATFAKYSLFEPNDEFTRLQIVNTINPYLRDVKARRGIYDYLVVCDERNNTATRIDRNELWVDIYIKPTRAAEFIVLNFIATQTGASFTELVAATVPGQE